MARSLTPDLQRAGIALVAIVVVIALAGSAGQVVAIVFGGLAGVVLCRGPAIPVTHVMRFPVSPLAGAICLLVFGVLLVGLPLLATVGGQEILLFDAFYRAGALVFGGGHVVLPLLDAETVATGWVSKDSFLAGYGATQAMPGPLFTFAAYLGTVSNGIAGAVIALVAIFLPGLLLLVGTLPFWDGLRGKPMAQAAMRGANAAVVGILAAALYDPVWTNAILGPIDIALAVAGFVALVLWKVPPWIVVFALALGGGALGLMR
jgi:chromate transporter